MNWTALQRIRRCIERYGGTCPVVARPKRSARTEQKYRAFTASLAKPVPEYLRDKFFPHHESFALVPNDFPYKLAPGIRHWVLFANPEHTKMIKPAFIEQVVREKWPNSKFDVEYFINPIEWQSVPEVPHVQIFIRKKKKPHSRQK